MSDTTLHSRRRKITSRHDGQTTRGMVLEAAGQVFAERGFQRATSREICARAGANSAAINYYFGGKEALYEETLIEAHRRFISLEELNAIMESGNPVEEKLRSVLKIAVRAATRAPDMWALPLLLREVITPSAALPVVLRDAALPKVMVIRSLVKEVLGADISPEKERHATALLVLPCVMLVLFPDKLKGLLLPDFPERQDVLLDSMVTYALAGMRALRDSGSVSPGCV